MDNLLMRQNISVESRQDRVILNVGRLEIEMPYAASFRVAQGFRLASKDAMRYSKENVIGWAKLSKLDELPEITPNKVSPEKRITVRKNFNWKTGWEGELVKVMFGNNLVKFHFETALKISEWLRIAGRNSKAWAGERGTTMIASSILSNAEENYRLGI